MKTKKIDAGEVLLVGMLLIAVVLIITAVTN